MKSTNGFEHFELRESESSISTPGPLTYGSSSRRKKYLLGAAIVLLLLIALAVGLSLGLRGADDSNDKRDQDALAGNTTISASPTTTARPDTASPIVLLVSLDGFRASYLSYNVTPTLQRLIREGAYTPRLLSTYPSLTFPNHYTIATGLYPESHGIIDNQMFDMNLQKLYRLGSPESRNPEWYSGEPIWLTAQRQGKRSACFFWVASDVPVQGEYPNEYRPYNGSVPFTERVDTVLDWLSRPAGHRPDLVTLYFEEPDSTGHSYGPGPSEEMLRTLRMVDNTIARLVTGLEGRDLYDDVNIVIVSDHGMSARSCSRQVKLSDFFNTTEFQNMYVFTGASGRISNRYKFEKGFSLLNDTFVSTESILDRLSGQPHMAVYEKSHLPKRLHYANNIRIDDVVVKMDDEWVFSRYGSSGSGCSGGTHGWDSRYDSMSGLFIARGPAFKPGVVFPPFENIEIYNLITDVLQIKAAPNNGTRGSLHGLMRTPPALKDMPASADQRCRQLANVSDTDVLTHCNCSVQRPQVSQPIRSNIKDYLQPGFESNSSSSGGGGHSTICVSDDAHTTVFSLVLHMPLWTSFSVTRKEDITQAEDSCIVPCLSLPEGDKYMYTLYSNNASSPLTATALFAATNGCGNIAQSADVIPMMKSLKNDLWYELWHMVRAVTDTSLPSISVTLGPIFDYDYDGLADNVGHARMTRFADEGGQIPLPSHYFAVLARCPVASQHLEQCADHMDVLSFVLPSQQNTNGQSRERRLMENVARVRDVEQLTGLRFFSDLDPAVGARLRTHVPLTLWKRQGSWGQLDLCSEPGAVQCDSSYQPLLLISLDGFRADYLVKYNSTPSIRKLVQCGVHAPYMRSVYPTKTFPNHYTIVTGLYPESHGIVDNNMYDLGLGQKFCLSCAEAKDPAWWGGEPIWLTAKRHGLPTATYFWPGSDVPIQGEYPDYYKVYKNGVPYTERVQTVLQWLKLPAGERPHFLTLYFDEPDHTGHVVGPDSPEIGQKLGEVDAAIAELMEGLYQQDLHHCANIIVLADHGMSSLSCDRLIPLTADLSTADLGNMYVYDGPVGRISNRYRYGSPSNASIDPPLVSLRSILKRLECSESHLRVYTKQSMPMRHHYTSSPRIDEILLDADDQWLISRSATAKYCTGGNHGYDNLYASMHALFLAYGPAFKVGVELEPFENIELYNLMADLLQVTPAPNNGTGGSLHYALRTLPISPSHHPSSENSPPRLCDGGSGGGSDGGSGDEQQEIVSCNCSRNSLRPENNSSWTPPLAEPLAASHGPSLCVKRSADHALGYNQEMLSPAWVAYSAHMMNSTLAAEEGSSVACMVKDSWLPPSTAAPNTSALQGTGYVPASLLFGFQDRCAAAMASQVVPMLAGFKTGTWRKVEQLVADYSVKYGQIAVTVGPVFNDDATAVWHGRTNMTRLAGGVWPVPTHFFVVMARCASSSFSSSPSSPSFSASSSPSPSSSSPLLCWDSLQLLSFLVPHVDFPSNCQTFGEMLRENVARVRDIEIATGLRLFPELPPSHSARLRTFLPTSLWEVSPHSDILLPPLKPGTWVDQDCPPRDQADQKCPSDYQPVLLVSLDGFKPQYLGRGLTPVMDQLLTCGVHAPYMRPVFPTNTFPNHYTVVTGMYPESHGIVDNNMLDWEISHDRFSISSDIKNDPRWWGGEPIWLTAQKQNVSSASVFWVGSDVPVQGSYPDLFKYYTGSLPYSSRVSTIVDWMGLPPDRRPQLLMLYFDEPDHQAHVYGPFTQQVDAEIQRVDNTLGELMTALYQKDLHHCVNLLLLSDHGFSHLSCDRVIEMQDHFNSTEMDDLYFYYGPFSRISNTYNRTKEGSIQQHQDPPPMSVREVLDHLRCVDHLKAYDKRDLPVRHHYANNRRIDNIILSPALNWTVSDKVNTRFCTGGSHGWDNTYGAMEALFVGYGPAFKNGETVKEFENIELYNMISDLLGIQPAPNNGTEGSLDHLLWRKFNRTRSAATLYNTTPASLTAAITCNCTVGNGNWSASTILQNLTSQNMSRVNAEALPFGTPLLMMSDMAGDVSLLHQPTYVTAYRSSRLLPLWVSATVSSASVSKDNMTNSCGTADPRVSDTVQCERLFQLPDSVSFVSLLPLGYDLGPTSLLLSSQIPMPEEFYTDVWQPLHSYLRSWSAGYQDLNIIAGPAFDGDNDRLADILNNTTRFQLNIPTHVFLIVSRCENSSLPVSRCDNIQTLTFILPQVDSSKKYNCQSVAEYLLDNEARVRDVELMTGLHFFPDLPFTQAVAMRTFLPGDLWP